MVRWLPSTTENASGPHIPDPRTGEILNADIQFYHNVQKLVDDWYFDAGRRRWIRARASFRCLTIPDGRAARDTWSRTRSATRSGLQHNMKASSMYPADKLRDPEWLKTMGHTPSIMDYSRFNYVAQPEDKIDRRGSDPGDRAVRQVGDHLGLRADHRRQESDDENKTLDTWAREQEKTPWLRFSTDRRAGRRFGREYGGGRRRRCRETPPVSA